MTCALVSWALIAVLPATANAQQYATKIQYVRQLGKHEQVLVDFGFLIGNEERVTLTKKGKKTSTHLSFYATKVKENEFIVEVGFTQLQDTTVGIPIFTNIRSSVSIELDHPINLGGFKSGESNEMLVILLSKREQPKKLP